MATGSSPCACSPASDAMGTRPLTWHWHASAAAGWLLTGAYRPLCSIVWDIPECAPTQAFKARMDRLFGVTMAEQGVSQLVSVDLKRAEALVA